jgi:hypothetical protein
VAGRSWWGALRLSLSPPDGSFSFSRRSRNGMARATSARPPPRLHRSPCRYDKPNILCIHTHSLPIGAAIIQPIKRSRSEVSYLIVRCSAFLSSALMGLFNIFLLYLQVLLITNNMVVEASLPELPCTF